MRHILLLAVISVMGAGCGTGPSGGPELVGIVTDSLSGAPINGARIRIEVLPDYPVDSTTSGADGAYRLLVPANCCARITAFASFYPRRDYPPQPVDGLVRRDIRLLKATPYAQSAP